LLALASYSSAAWIPEFYRRHFHWDSGTTGIVYGSIVAVSGCLGIAGAGWIADHVRSRGRANANLLVGAVAGVALVPLNCLLYLAPSAVWATIWLIPAAALTAASVWNRSRSDPADDAGVDARTGFRRIFILRQSHWSWGGPHGRGVLHATRFRARQCGAVFAGHRHVGGMRAGGGAAVRGAQAVSGEPGRAKASHRIRPVGEFSQARGFSSGAKAPRIFGPLRRS
jgi:hypothetical protein